MLILGVDPGAKGGLAIVGFSGSVPYIAAKTIMPMRHKVISGKKRGKIDLEEAARWIDSHASKIKFCIFEDVGAMPRQGVTSMFSFGQNTGQVEGIIAANFIPIHYVKPRKWKKWLHLSDNKDASLDLARQTFGKEHFPLKKHDGVAEAALMTLWAKDQLRGVAA